MKNPIVKLAFTLVVFFNFPPSFAQSKRDSLTSVLKKASHDTVRINTLNELAWQLRKSNPDTAIIVAGQSLELIRKTNYQEKLDYTLCNLGIYYYIKHEDEKCLSYLSQAITAAKKNDNQQGQARVFMKIGDLKKSQEKYSESIDSYLQSFQTYEVIRDTLQKIKALINIANAYGLQSNYSKALEFSFKALKIAEGFKDKTQEGMLLGNIAATYSEQKNYNKALVYYEKAIKISEKLGDLVNVGIIYSNMANVYSEQGAYEKALDYYFKSLKIAEETDDIIGQGIVLGGIAIVYQETKEYTKALDYSNRSLKIAKETEDRYNIASTIGNIAEVYMGMGNYGKAEEQFKKGIAISKEIGAMVLEKDQEYAYVKLCEKMNRPAEAYIHYKRFIQLRDTIYNQENTKRSMQTEMSHEFDKKQSIAQAEHKSQIEKQQAVADEKQRRQTMVIWSVVAGLLLVVVFAGFILKSLRTTTKQKQIIEIKNRETEQQKHIIEEKHKEITDSINYAERIQRSFLASNELLIANLNEHFVFFQPKDVVSGDFYWAAKLSNGNFALVTADSTGHGVPGAIMSILNISSLEKAVEQGLTEPSEIVGHTRKTIIERLKKDGSAEGGKDGMDASLISFNNEKTKFIYTAANNPVWVARGNELIELAADKMPIGKHDRDTTAFTQHEFDLLKGDVIYTLTDGMPDQFGGPKGKKYMYKKLKELLLTISPKTMEEQKQILKNELSSWKGMQEQVDDVCLIGVRI